MSFPGVYAAAAAAVLLVPAIIIAVPHTTGMVTEITGKSLEVLFLMQFHESEQVYYLNLYMFHGLNMLFQNY